MKIFFLNLIIIYSVYVFANESAMQQTSTPNIKVQNQPSIQTQPPEMPIPPEMMTPGPATDQLHQKAMPVSAKPPVDPSLELPHDFEFIGVMPYFKNKSKMGTMTATLTNENEAEILATITQDFGDCKSCLRGASVKGKVGLRLYGKSLDTLMVSSKYSSSIKVTKCPTSVPFQDGRYVCEFMHQNKLMKLVVKVAP